MSNTLRAFRIGDTNIKSNEIQEFNVGQIIIHPGFILTDQGPKNDVAILKLSEKYQLDFLF